MFIDFKSIRASTFQAASCYNPMKGVQKWYLPEKNMPGLRQAIFVAEKKGKELG